MALPRWVTSRAPASAAASATSAGARRMAERHEHAPGAERGDGVEGAGQLGGQGDDAHQARRGSRASAGRPRRARTRGDGRRARPGRALRDGPRRCRGGPAPGARAASAIAASEASSASSGAVTRVGHHVVTPWASRARSSAVPVRAGGAGHVDGADPVHLEVDEARAPGPRRGRRRVAGRTSAIDAVLDHDLGVGHRARRRAPPWPPARCRRSGRRAERRCRFVAWARGRTVPSRRGRSPGAGAAQLRPHPGHGVRRQVRAGDHGVADARRRALHQPGRACSRAGSWPPAATRPWAPPPSRGRRGGRSSRPTPR